MVSTAEFEDQRAQARVKINGQEVRIYAFRCGSVTVKKLHYKGILPESTSLGLRFAAILADPRFAPPMPIWCYVIEHPSGLIVVDTGADPEYADQSSWAGHQVNRRLLHSFIRVDVARGETLPEQMQAANFSLEDVEAVILTHQHIDHTGTVRSFARSDLWTTRAEDDAAQAIGAEQWRWLDPKQHVRHVDQEGQTGKLGTTVDLFGDGSIEIIHTPGHTPGSITVCLTHDNGTLWMTGDTSFTADSLNPAAPTAGIHSDVAMVRRLQSALMGRGLFFPSHDPQVAARLRSLDAAWSDR